MATAEGISSPNSVHLMSLEDSVVIAVMGRTGTGKTSFITTVAGSDAGSGHKAQLHIGGGMAGIEVIRYEYPEKSDLDIVFLDTPGFDDSKRTGAEVLESIMDWLKEYNNHHECEVSLAGILYFHRITDKRMAAPPAEDVDMFKQLCGTDDFEHIILTTTMWDQTTHALGLGREEDIKSKYWKRMIDQGSVTARFHSTQESAWDILNYFVQHTNARYDYLLRGDMVDMRKLLHKHDHRQMLCTELEQQIYKQQECLKMIRYKSKICANGAALDVLRAEYDTLRMDLVATVDEMQRQKLPFGRYVSRLTRSLMCSSTTTELPPQTQSTGSEFNNAYNSKPTTPLTLSPGSGKSSTAALEYTNHKSDRDASVGEHKQNTLRFPFSRSEKQRMSEQQQPPVDNSIHNYLPSRHLPSRSPIRST